MRNPTNHGGERSLRGKCILVVPISSSPHPLTKVEVKIRAWKVQNSRRRRRRRASQGLVRWICSGWFVSAPHAGHTTHHTPTYPPVRHHHHHHRRRSQMERDQQYRFEKWKGEERGRSGGEPCSSRSQNRTSLPEKKRKEKKKVSEESGTMVR